MDEGKLRLIFADQISERDWSNGVSKDDLLATLEGYPAFREIVTQYVADETFTSPELVMAVIPEQAWQDAQGGIWRGGEVGDVEGMHSNFEGGPVGQDESEVYHPGSSPPPTPGFGHISTDESDRQP